MINELLDKTGKLYCQIEDTLISLNSVFLKKDDTYLLQCEINVNEFNKLDIYSSHTIYGDIFDKPVTFMNSYINSVTYGFSDNFVSATIKPYVIILGYSSPEPPLATMIRMSSVHLNYMVMDSPVRASKSSPSLLEHSLPYNLSCDDKYGKLSIYQYFTQSFSWEKWQFDIKTAIEYQFFEPLPINESIARIAATINLFSFFATRYLPLENIEFSSSQEEENTPELYTLYFNNSNDIPVEDSVFYITSECFSPRFETIWNNWLKFYEESYIPTLFYEIICNRSTRINRFLNLIQAIEIYSKKYREKEAREIVKRQNSEHNNMRVSLKHRVEEIFSYLDDFFLLSEDERKKLSTVLSHTRNLYTHYSEKFSEPSYQDIFAACHILEFVILSIVFLHLGIDKKDILECRNAAKFHLLDSRIKMLLK